MKTKKTRYYEVLENTAHIYDTPYKDNSLSLSIVPVTDLSYYRNNFRLLKVKQGKWEGN